MSMLQPSHLALFWVGVIACSVLLYVILDGFDLGVGILFGSTRNEARRHHMLRTIAPFWDGNQTWLVIVGAGLFACFPVVYAVFLSAFYMPMLLLLVGLIFRGVAFEFRDHSSPRMRWLWDTGFTLGSTVAAFVQGATTGALMRGIPVVDEQFAGTSWEWLHPFSVLTGIGQVFVYALLGAGWIVLKSDGSLRAWAYGRIGWLAAAVLMTFGLAFAVSISVDAGAIAQSNLHHRPWGLAFPMGVVAALAGLVALARLQRFDGITFALTAVVIVATYLTVSVMFWPYMIPYAVTVANAAAPDASLRFLFYGGIVALPVILIYTAGVYWVFRGKVSEPKLEA